MKNKVPSSLLRKIGFIKGNLPVSTSIPNSKYKKIIRDFRWAKGFLIEAGFKSDGASVPRIGWGITYPPNHPKVSRAAWIHDYLYTTHEVDKHTADQIFRDICILDGGIVRAQIMYRMLRMFGKKAWNKGGKN